MAGMFSDESIQRVREANDIVSVAEAYISLKRAGSAYKALCPFHNEKSPSFTVNPSLQLFKCFGCGEGGDVFKFVMKMDGLSFPESVELLANRTGIQLEQNKNVNPDSSRAANEEKKHLLWATRRATLFYENALHNSADGSEGLRYLTDRGFSLETIKSWRVGWAPDSFNALQSYLTKESTGQHEQTLEIATRAGLLRKNERGSLYDFFRGRVIFPILNLHGQPIAFGGRILKQDPAHPVGKYINSPETPLFNKSQVLFGLDAASREIRISRVALIVEGYTDVIMCHQYGIRNAVATLGTALTIDHIRLLRRHCDSVIAMFDSDEAGAKATDRAIRLFMEEGLPLKVVRSLDLKDACDFLPEKGVSSFNLEIERSLDSFSYALQRAFDFKDKTSVDEKTDAIRSVMEIANLCKDPVKLELMRKTVASYSGVSIDTLPRMPSGREMKDRGVPIARAARNQRSQPASSNDGRADLPKPEKPPATGRQLIRNEQETLEKSLLPYMIDSRDWCDKICRIHSPEQFSTPTMVDLATEIHDLWSDTERLTVSMLVQRLQNPEASSILSHLIMGDNCLLTENNMDESLRRIRKLKLENERRRVHQELVQAQTTGNIEKINNLSREDYLIARDIQELI